MAVNGAVSVNWVYTGIGAFIKDCSGPSKGVTAYGDIVLDAFDRTAVSVIAGGVSGAGIAGGGAAGCRSLYRQRNIRGRRSGGKQL
ncbi:hypothetical protein MASR2M70_13630 [Bacillota bacterium]